MENKKIILVGEPNIAKPLNEIIEQDKGITITQSPTSKQYIDTFERQDFAKKLKDVQFFDKLKSKFHK